MLLYDRACYCHDRVCLLWYLGCDFDCINGPFTGGNGVSTPLPCPGGGGSREGG